MSAPLSPPLAVAPGVDLYVGDNLDVLPMRPAASVQCVVTSPPYWGLRDYGLAPRDWPAIEYAPMAGLPTVVIPAERSVLGLETTIEAFIGHTLLVFRGVARVLRDDGTCWVNLGDCYVSDRKWGGATSGKHTKWLHGDSNIGRGRRFTGLPEKSLCGVPWRFALAMQADGWTLRSEVIWAKRNVMPSSVRDRPTTAHEQLFLFTRGEKYFYDADAIAEPLLHPASSSTRDRARAFSRRRATALAPRQDGIDSDDDAPTTATTKNRRTVWSIATQPFKGAHFATFPEALVEPCILAGCPVGGRVLDPFAGSGTVGAVARRLGRGADLVEASAPYVPLIVERVNAPVKARPTRPVRPVADAQLALSLPLPSGGPTR